MKSILWTLPGFALATAIGCSGGKDGTDPTDGGTGDGGTSACDVEITSNFPADGSDDAYYRTTVEFKLNKADPNGTPTITVNGGGSDVAGTTTLSEDSKTVIFTPSSPLASNTTYTATIEFCRGEDSISFTTSGLGAPLTASIDGNAYVVDLQGADFVQPAGVADLLLGQLENNILLGVKSSSPNLQMIGAISEDGSTAQDMCNESIPFPAADFSQSPYFQVGPQDTTISVAGFDVDILELAVSGTFASDGSYFGGGTLAGELDARLLAPLVGDLLGTTDPDAICGVVAGFGVSCQACSSDGQPYCLEVFVRDITATKLSASVVEVTAADVAANPSCTE